MAIFKDELSEIIKMRDEQVTYRLSLSKEFYVLKESAEGRAARGRLIGLANQIPVNEVRNNWLNNLSKEPFFISIEGDFSPDLLEEKGIYLVSRQLLDYLKQKLTLGNIIYNLVGLVSKDKRVEEYFVLIPEEIDCIKKNSAIYNKDGTLHCFEIDETKTRALQIFKIAKFPHLIVTQKLNRIDYTGYECVSLENYCDYEGERDRLFQERRSGKRLKDTQTEFEKQLDLINRNYKYTLQNSVKRTELQRMLNQGFKEVLGSYSGKLFENDDPSGRFLVFFWSWDSLSIELAEEFGEYFEKRSFALPVLEKLKGFITGLPQELEWAQQYIWESILELVIKESLSFNSYQKIHQNQRFRWYLQDETFQYSLALIGDFKNPFQQKLESVQDFRKFDLSNQNLREFNFEGKNLGQLKIENSNLNRAKFVNSDLANVQFTNCDLTGVKFCGCKLTAVKFSSCYLDRTVFDTVKLEGAEFGGCYFNHTSFIKSDVTGAKFKNQDLTRLYFYKTKLLNAIFEVSENMVQSVFQHCDLKNASITGDVVRGEIIMNNCDFRNSDLTGCRIAVNIIADTNFVKAVVNSTDFTGCEQLIGCDLRWGSCFEMNLDGVTIEDSDLSYTNFSMLKSKKNIRLLDNNLSFANLSDIDFSGNHLFTSNILICASLSNCNLEAVDFCSSKMMNTEFHGAKMKSARFLEEQLLATELSSRQKSEIEIVRKPANGSYR